VPHELLGNVMMAALNHLGSKIAPGSRLGDDW
jgi:hypothetical protein